MVKTLGRLMDPLHRRIRQLFTRGMVHIVDSTTLMQSLQVELLKDELLDAVEHAEPYGYTSHPHPGAEVFTASAGGCRDHIVALIAADRRYRLKNLAEGEVALYDDLGNVVHLMRNKIKVVAVQHLEVTAPTCHITATTTHDGNVTINGNLAVNGNTTVSGTTAVAGALSSATSVADSTGTMQSMRGTYNDHTHNETGSITNAPNQGM